MSSSLPDITQQNTCQALAPFTTASPDCGASAQTSKSNFHLKYLPGLFHQSDIKPPMADRRLSLTTPHDPHMGLVEPHTWQDIDALIESKKAEGIKAKLILILRHGEGIHNVDKTKYGEQAWEEHYSKLDVYLDAPLTELGRNQARYASEVLAEEMSTKNGLTLDLVVVSPLDRTLETYALAFENQPQIPTICLELARETLGVAPCDKRLPTGPKKPKYPQVDFSLIEDEEDAWWLQDHRESDTEIEERAKKLLSHLFYEREETKIAVVSHSGLSRACLRALEHPYYRPRNAEYVPLLLIENQTMIDFF